ncbi:MAG: adenylate kinase [Bacteroidota bacterium]
MSPCPYKRIVVVGSSGSGKSILAERLSERLGLKYVELDALNWQPKWTPAPLPDFRRSVEAALGSGESAWVVAGNYGMVRSIIWPRAQAIIWLDYSLPLIFWRLLKRTTRRVVMQEELWNGNREKLWPQLKLWSDDSLFHWLFKTYWRRKRELPALFALPGNAHLNVIRFSSPHETEKWFAAL